MAHDGQDLSEVTPVLLDDLLTLTAAAIAPVDAVTTIARDRLRGELSVDGRISGALIEQNQTAAHGLAWLSTYAESLRQMQKWAEALTAQLKFGEVEALIHQIAFGEYLCQIYGGIQMNQGEVLRLQDMGLTRDDMQALMVPAVQTLTLHGNTQATRVRLSTHWPVMRRSNQLPHPSHRQ